MKSFLILAIWFFSASLLRASGPSNELFDLRNGFWINLHHFLYAQALAQPTTANARWISSAQDAIKKAPCDRFDSTESVRAWDDAVGFYAGNYASRDLLFDLDFAHINDVLGDTGNARALPGDLPADLRAQLAKVAPIYRRSCWPNHSKANQEWIASLRPLLAVHGAKIASQLAKIYRTEWPSQPLPTDVVIYANWAGAYTVPPHITIGSLADAPGSAQLETIFHESLHTMDQRMIQDLNEAFARNHSQPSDLDHVIIFFTAGFVTQQELRSSDPNFQPYAYRHGMYKRVQYWDQDESALRKYWQPFLEGKATREDALVHLTHAVCCE